MAISVDINGDQTVMIVEMGGSLTYDDWPEFRNKCLQLPRPLDLLLDFRRLEEINVAGFSMLLLLHRRLSHQDRRITLLTCSEPVRNFLYYVDYERWFRIPDGCCMQQETANCSGVCHEAIREFKDKHYAG